MDTPQITYEPPMPDETPPELLEAVQTWVARQKTIRILLGICFGLLSIALAFVFATMQHALLKQKLEGVLILLMESLFCTVPAFYLVLTVQQHLAVAKLRRDNPLLWQMDDWETQANMRKKSILILGIIIAVGLLLTLATRVPLFPVLTVVVLLCVRARYAHRETYATAEIAATIAPEVRCRQRSLGCAAVLVPFVLVSVIVLGALLDFVAATRVRALAAQAEVVYRAAVEWQQENENTFSGATIYALAEEGATGTFAHQLDAYLNAQTDGWCAVVCDADGTIQYTLYSREEITADELEPMPIEEQREMEADFFRRGGAIGYYMSEKEIS